MELNKVINKNCIGENGMCSIESKSIDLIFADLPFGTTRNKWDIVIPLDRLWEQYNRVIKDDGVIALCCVEPFTSMIVMSNLNHFKYKIVWEKSKATNFLNAKKQPLRKYEEIAIFYKKIPTYNPQFTNGIPYNKGTRKDQVTGSYGNFKPVEVKSDGRRYPTDILYFKTAESEGEVIHPTQKPVSLCQYIIRQYSNSGDLILDNATGSGSIPIGCISTGRNFIAFDNGIDDRKQSKNFGVEWADLATKRIEELKARQGTLQE